MNDEPELTRLPFTLATKYLMRIVLDAKETANFKQDITEKTPGS